MISFCGINRGVLLRKSVKSIVVFLLSFLFFINVNIAASAESKSDAGLKAARQVSWPLFTNIEVLYPVHLRRDVFFDGRLTGENIEYLKSIPHTEALSALNVLRGNSDGNLMLDKFTERVEGAVMLVRLLGAEEYAGSAGLYHPFSDVPDWANPYIGYLYQTGLTNGIGNNKFGSRDYIDEKSYLAFLLRALGYSDKNGRDFTWDTVGSTALKAGLLVPGEEVLISNLLKRERLSQLSWRAMFLNHRVHNKPLLICLYEQGMIKHENLAALFANNRNRLIDQWFDNLSKLEKAFVGHDEKIELTISQKQKNSNYHEYLEYVLERVQLSTGVFLHEYSIELWQYGSNYTLILYPRYANTASGDAKLRQLVDEIISGIISPGMTDYEKVKAVHDYLVTRLEYDTRENQEVAPSSFSALGALETGIAVCKAYSELMALILNRAGVPCRIVVGSANRTEHAWNMVCIDGELYHVDTTWDDPVSNYKRNTIRYDYFNLSDADIGRDHYWNRNNYPACTSTEQNYFVKNNLIYKNTEDFRAAITELVENRKTDLTIRYLGDNYNEIDIHRIINEVNSVSGYVISRYVYSVNEAMGVIYLEAIEYNE